MNFFSLTNQQGTTYKTLVIQLKQDEYDDLVGKCEQCMPTLTFSSLIRGGHVYVVADFGGWKTAIPLDEESEDGHKVGDELGIGDILTVILTSKQEAISISEDRAYLNVPFDQIVAFSFLYTADIAQNYAIFNMHKQPKAE
jgi:hypothetical protein